MKGNLELCQSYGAICLISYTTKVMFRIKEQIINLRIMCYKYMQHQQNMYVVFIVFMKAFILCVPFSFEVMGRMCNSIVSVTGHCLLVYFDRLWHEVLGAIMRNFNINANIILVIESLYDKAQSQVLFKDSTDNWFRNTARVQQGFYSHQPSLTSSYRESGYLTAHIIIMREAFGVHEGCVSIAGLLITQPPLCKWHGCRCRRGRRG